MAFLDELLKGVGGVASAAWRSTSPGATLHNQDRSKRREDFQNDWAAVQQSLNPDDKLKNMKTLMEKWPDLIQLGQDYSQNAMQTPDQQREQQKWDMLDQTEKKDMATRDQWGRRPATTDEIGTLDEGERWMAIAKGASSDELASKAEKRAEELLFPKEEPGVDAGAFRSMLFGPEEGPGVSNRTSAAPPPDQQGHSFAPGAAAPPAAVPVDNRGMFVGNDNPFNLTPESRANVESFLDEDLSTPEKKSPHTFMDIGITQAKQQQEFQELEELVQSQIPDMDLRQSYALHPESYKKLFAAIQDGVPDQKSGETRKLTTAEIMQAIQSMGR